MDQNNASTRSSNVVPLKRGKLAIDEPATASETQASVRATDDTFDSWMPGTWPDGMRAFLKNSNAPSTDDAAEAYQTWRQLQIEDERNVLLRSIVDAKLATPSATDTPPTDADIYTSESLLADYYAERKVVRQRSDGTLAFITDHSKPLKRLLPKFARDITHTFLSTVYILPVVRALYEGFELRAVQARRNINSKGGGRGGVGELLIW